MRGRLQIQTPDEEIAARQVLNTLELRFVARPDSDAGPSLAREIIRLRMALTSYALRHQVREAHDRQVAGSH